MTSLDYEQEDLILEDNGCPGVHGARLHGPGTAYPFMVTRTGYEEAAVSPEHSPATSNLAPFNGVNFIAVAATASILPAGPAKNDVQRSSGEATQRAKSPLLSRAAHGFCTIPRAVCTCACIESPCACLYQIYLAFMAGCERDTDAIELARVGQRSLV